MPKKKTIETNEVAEDRTCHKTTEQKMSNIFHWTRLRTALRLLLVACLLPCGVSLGVESPEAIQKVGDHTWLVNSDSRHQALSNLWQSEQRRLDTTGNSKVER